MMLSHVILHSLIQGIDLLAMVLLVGGVVFRTLVVSQSSGQNLALERFLPFLLLLIGLIDLMLRSQMITGRPLMEVWGFLPTVLFKSHFGKVWMARTFLLCLIGVASIIKIPQGVRKTLALITSGVLLLTESLSGHAADFGDFSLAVLADWLHLLAVSAWLGGLFFLASFLRRWILSTQPEPMPCAAIESVKRFSTLAGFAVALIVITGSYQLWNQVGTLAALYHTPYGQTLLTKLFLVVLLLSLGALNRYLMLPRLSQAGGVGSGALVRTPSQGLLRTVSVEIAVGLGVIACVALLAQLPPARSQLGSEYKVSAHPMGHSSQGEARPSKLQPAEGAKVTILSPKEGQLLSSDQVPIHFKLVKGKRGEHVHAYVDGELMGMFQSEKGTLTGIQPGRHTLELRVVADDHKSELDATERVDFVVK